MPKSSYSRTHPGLGLCSPRPRGRRRAKIQSLGKEEERKKNAEGEREPRASLKIASLSSSLTTMGSHAFSLRER
jgi:hypothetical protein